MNVTFLWFSEEVLNNTDTPIVYGITATENGTVSKKIHNITSCRNEIINLVNLLNENNLDIIHLEEAVENYLFDFTI